MTDATLTFNLFLLFTINDLDYEDEIRDYLQRHNLTGGVSSHGSFDIDQEVRSDFPLYGLRVGSVKELCRWEAVSDILPSNIIVYGKKGQTTATFAKRFIDRAIIVKDALDLVDDAESIEDTDGEEEEGDGSGEETETDSFIVSDGDEDEDEQRTIGTEPASSWAGDATDDDDEEDDEDFDSVESDGSDASEGSEDDDEDEDEDEEQQHSRKRPRNG